LKNIVILGLIMASMIATESMLRTDDYDSLTYLTDAEEVKTAPKVDPVPFPTGHTCGTSATLPNPLQGDCTGQKIDTTKRCCWVTGPTPATGSAQSFCVTATDNYLNTADENTATTTHYQTSVSSVCQDPVGTLVPTTSNCGAAAADKTKGNVLADCTGDLTQKCCLVTSWDPKVLPVCLQGNKSFTTHQKTAQDSLQTTYPYSDPLCVADPATPAKSECGVADLTKSPATAQDCWRDLKNKCCMVTNTATPTAANVCVIASTNRALPDTDAVTALTNKYFDYITAPQCQKVGAVFPDKSTCGYDGKATLNQTTTNVTDKANCTTGDNSNQYCCYVKAASAGLTAQARCVTSGSARSAINGTDPTVKTTEQYKLDDLYVDLQDVECSSKFVSAGIAIIAVVLALF